MPLFLEGLALAVCLEMGEEAQQNMEKIEARLKEAFTEGAFVSYAWLRKARWTGEQWMFLPMKSGGWRD